MTHYTLTVPVKGKDDVTRYPRVGVMFRNTHRETGDEMFSLKLDFPVGVTELVAFPPKDRDAQAEEKGELSSEEKPA